MGQDSLPVLSCCGKGDGGGAQCTLRSLNAYGAHNYKITVTAFVSQSPCKRRSERVFGLVVEPPVRIPTSLIRVGSVLASSFLLMQPLEGSSDGDLN